MTMIRKLISARMLTLVGCLLLPLLSIAAVSGTTYDTSSTTTTAPSTIAKYAAAVEMISLSETSLRRIASCLARSLLGLSQNLNAPKTTGGGKNVSLYHKGKLQGGKVSDYRKLSTTRSQGSAAGYAREGSVHRFDVPEKTYQQWLREGSAQPFRDVDLPSGGRFVDDAIDIFPPRSGDLNQFRVP